MIDWLKRRFGSDKGPMYAEVQRVPSHTLPDDLQALEASLEHQQGLEACRRMLLEPPRRPDATAPLFFMLAGPSPGTLVTIVVPESGGQCLPIFLSSTRAMDYAAVRLGRSGGVPGIATSVAELAAAAPGLLDGGIGNVAFDVCPRCSVMTSVGVESLASPERTLSIWAQVRASRDARSDLYLDYAGRCVERGEHRTARDIAFEIVAHVAPDDVRPHWLLGQISVAGGDRTLLAEATRFLRLLGSEGWAERLDACARAGTPEFAYPPRLAERS